MVLRTHLCSPLCLSCSRLPADDDALVLMEGGHPGVGRGSWRRQWSRWYSCYYYCCYYCIQSSFRFETLILASFVPDIYGLILLCWWASKVFNKSCGAYQLQIGGVAGCQESDSRTEPPRPARRCRTYGRGWQPPGWSPCRCRSGWSRTSAAGSTTRRPRWGH